MSQRASQLRQRPSRDAAKGAHTPNQSLSPDELALLRAVRQQDTTTLSATGASALARQIGNRAMGAYIARVPGDENLDALLGGGPAVPTATAEAPAPATAGEPGAAVEQAGTETTAGSEAETGSVEQAAAPPAPAAVEQGSAAPAGGTAKPEPGATGVTAGVNDQIGAGAGGTNQASDFEPKKEPFSKPIPKAPANQVGGGLRPNPFESEETVGVQGPNAPTGQVSGGLRPNPFGTEETVGPASAGVESASAETPQAQPETARTPEVTQTEGAANQAEEQGEAQAEAAGNDVEQAASTGEAEVSQAEESAETQAAAPTAEQPAGTAGERREPSWLGRAREALSRVLGHIRRGVGVVTDRAHNLGTRIHDLAQRGVQEATRIIRQVGTAIGTAVSAVLSRLHGMVAAIVSRASQIAGEIRAAAARAVNFVLSLLGNIGERIRTGVRDFLTNAYRRIVPIVRAVREAASRLLTQLTQRVVLAITQRAEQVRSALRTAVQFVVGRISSVRNDARSLVERLFGGEAPLPERAREWLRERVQRLGQPILDAIARAVGNATTRVTGRLRTVFTTVATPLRSAWNMARTFLQAHVLPVIAPAREYVPEIADEVDLGMSDAEAAAETVTGAIDAQVNSTEAAAQAESANLQTAISGGTEV
jgi:hypothetical protein